MLFLHQFSVNSGYTYHHVHFDYLVLLLFVLSLFSLIEAQPARQVYASRVGGMNQPPPRGGPMRTRRVKTGPSKGEVYRRFTMTQ